MLEFRELRFGVPDDMRLLEDFYHHHFLCGFPDPDEVESLENISKYLELQQEGWYGDNNYHVTVVLDDGRPVGGSISDYFATPNVGVIEFLVVDRDRRRTGLGSRVLEATEQALRDDAKRAHGRDLGRVIAELEDPYSCGPSTDGLDPFDRVRVWHRWGYRMLDFPYVQPALSGEQRPVEDLMLIARTLPPQRPDSVPAADLVEVLHEYMYWAMRITEPRANVQLRTMSAYAGAHDPVPLRRLDDYLGSPEQDALMVTEIGGALDPALDGVIEVYESLFTDPATAVPSSVFRAAFAPLGLYYLTGFHYHLWAISGRSASGYDGMVSILTMPSAGFGGYIGFLGSLRGTGRLRQVIALIERQMLRDRPDTQGWYIECEGHPEIDVFTRVGFTELAVPYRQPGLPGGDDSAVGHALHLLYKPIGRSYEPLRLNTTRFLRAIRELFSSIYEIATPDADPAFDALSRHLAGHETVPTTRESHGP